jgi:chromosomal replication initiator protein
MDRPKFFRPIQEAVHEVLGCTLSVRFSVVPELFDLKLNNSPDADKPEAATQRAGRMNSQAQADMLDDSRRTLALMRPQSAASRVNSVGLAPPPAEPLNFAARPRLRHDLSAFVVGPSNQLAFTTVTAVAEFPATQYNPLFIHGNCGLGKTHLLHGLCRQFAETHTTRRWMYMTGEQFTNEFLTALRGNKLDTFRRKMRDLDMLVIDDVHFLGGKKATQEEFLHTFNAIEAMGKQVVMASDEHPKMIEEFGESLINRFVSGMVVRIDPPNFATRVAVLQSLAHGPRWICPRKFSDGSPVA